MLASMWRKRNPHTLLMEMEIGTAATENSMKVSQKLKIEQPYEPAIPLLGIHPKRKKRKY